MTVVSIRCAAFTHLLETDLLLCVRGYDGPGPASPGGVSVTPCQTDRILSIPVRHLVLQSASGHDPRHGYLYTTLLLSHNLFHQRLILLMSRPQHDRACAAE